MEARDALTPAAVAELDYVGFITLIRETNRCPGGLASLRRQALASSIVAGSSVLEIGSNTGFTTLELVQMTGCRIVGVDVNPAAVREAQRRQALLPSEVRERVRFEVGDARTLSNEAESVDVIVCGGANSFIADRAAAFREYLRVLRPLGRLAITNFFYRQPPPASLLRSLHEVLGVPIPSWGQREWLRAILDDSPWEVIASSSHTVIPRTEATVREYVDRIVAGAGLGDLRPETREAVRERWLRTCKLFNENSRYLGYFELVLRRPIPGLESEPQLFLSDGEYDPWFERDVVRAS